MLSVLPVALTPGRPLVDVVDVEARARLAERYGLLVLHWERSGITTYVVQDEGATYWYRTGGRGRQPSRWSCDAQPASATLRSCR